MRRKALVLGGLGAAAALWLVVANWVAPRLIHSAYEGRSLSLLNELLAGRDQHPVEFYLDHWNTLQARFTWLMTVIVVGLTTLLIARGGMGGRDADRSEPGVRDLLWFAVTAGAMFGLGEAGAIWWRATVRGLVVNVTPHVAWMAPASYAVLFLAVIVTWLLIARHPTLRSPAVPVTLCVALGLVGWLEMLPWALYPVAVWALAIGAASRAGAWAAARPSMIVGASRLAGPTLAAVVLVGAAATAHLDWQRERTALSRLPAPRSGAPNVLLLILDTVRAKSLGLYGGRPETSPFLDSLAGQAVVFDRAISPAPWTLPSHASMFTGRWPHELSVGWSQPLDGREPTLAEVLSSEGYATAGLVANLSYTSRAYGLARGFVHYEDFPMSLGQVVLSTSLGRELGTSSLLRRISGSDELLNRKTASHLRTDLVDWLDSRPSRPFFAFVNFFDAHEPYEPPDDLRARFAPGYERSDVEHRHNLLRGVNARRVERWTMTPEEIAGEVGLYEGAIAALDAELGRIVQELDVRGLLDSTLVIVTSDHGEQMGEHDLHGHLQSVYQPVTHVPLLVRLPGGASAARVDRAVSLRDLPATVLDLIGADPTQFPGTSLASLWSPPPNGDSLALAESTASPAHAQLRRGQVDQPWYPIASGRAMHSFVVDGLHYICNPDATEELFDLRRDPDELDNLVGTPAADSAIASFRTLSSAIGAPPPPCPPSGPARPPLNRAKNSVSQH
jgi:arylsulfatase A-like enzyme